MLFLPRQWVLPAERNRERYYLVWPRFAWGRSTESGCRQGMAPVSGCPGSFVRPYRRSGDVRSAAVLGPWLPLGQSPELGAFSVRGTEVDIGRPRVPDLWKVLVGNKPMVLVDLSGDKRQKCPFSPLHKVVHFHSLLPRQPDHPLQLVEMGLHKSIVRLSIRFFRIMSVGRRRALHGTRT